MNKDDTLHAIMLSELPQVGEKAAQRILATNRERRHTLATFFRLPEAIMREEYELHAVAVERLTVGRNEHETRCRWLADNLERVGGEALLIDGITEGDACRADVRPRYAGPGRRRLRHGGHGRPVAHWRRPHSQWRHHR